MNFANCIVSNNTATGDGGGVYNTGGGITFTACTFSNNVSSAEGGGMYTYGSGNGSYTLVSCTFSNNKAAGNGGGYCVDNGSLPVTLTNCVFSANSSTNAAYDGGGGGMYVTNGSTTVTGCLFSNNSSSGFGGGLIINQGSNQPISYCTFTSNTATIFGGGLACVNGSAPIVSNCNFSSNAAAEGGGIYDISGSPTFKYDTLFGNSATAAAGTGGGGMCSDTSANPIVSHCWFNANVTSGSNGAGLFEQSSAGNDSNCVFQANIAKGTASNGGGLYHLNGTSKVWNSVFLSNSCTGGYGGGIYNNANSTYEHLTLYNNYSTASTSTTGYGDGIYVAGGSPKVYNDIVWSTTAASFGVVYTSSITTYKVQYSDVQNGTLYASGTGNITSAPSFGAAGNPVGTDNIWATADDGLHLTGSAAADAVPAGNFLADDITDYARPDNGGPDADMGAYEGGGTFATLAVNDCVLTAAPNNSGGAELNWEATMADGVVQFVVERAGENGVFQPAGVVVAVGGQRSYHYVDISMPAGVAGYRVVMQEKDGSEVFSNVSWMPVVQAGYVVSLRPTVIHTGMASLFLTVPHAMSMTIALTDGSGRVLLRYTAGLSTGEQNLALSGLHFPAGVYYLCLRGDDGFETTIPLVML